MGSLIFEPNEKDEEFVDALIEGLNKFMDKMSNVKSNMTERDYVRANYCSNRDVATGNYDCPYATTVMNTICCTGYECNYKGIYKKQVVNNSAPYEPFVINEEDLPF